MPIDGEDRNEDVMWDRLEACILRLQGLQNILNDGERTEQCYMKAKEKIGSALKLVDAFVNSPKKGKNTEDEKTIYDALDHAEQYLNLGIFQDLASIMEKTDQELKELEDEIDEAIKQEEDESRDEWTHILHLSDLHFGIYLDTGDSEQDEEDYLEVVKEQLFPFLKDYLNKNKEENDINEGNNTKNAKKIEKIDIVAVTGDISYRCKEAGYQDFKDWLEKLCSKDLLDIDIKTHVIMCPGNHDKKSDGLSRTEDGLCEIKDAETRAGDVLSIDKIRQLQEQFPFFNDICGKLKIEPLTNFKKHTTKAAVPYVMGIREIDGIHFIVLNSAWNSFKREKNGSDHGQLFLGRRPMKTMLDAANIPKDEMTIMLFHHPLSWLHEEEKRTYSNDQADPSATLVRQHADVILNGHVHGGIEPPDILANKTLVFGGGTLYTKENDSYLNQFEIISINRTRHYCIQTVIDYNRQEKNGNPLGWRILEEKYSPRIHYGIYRDIRDLVVKYSLCEITMEEAMQAAYERSSEVGVKAFQEVLDKIKFQRIIAKRMQEKADKKMDESRGNAKTMTKDDEDGEKKS